jgi:hypothetical protein
MDAIGLRIEFRKAKWPELLRESRAGKLMMWGLGWTAGSPDADTFYQILYGPNKGPVEPLALRPSGVQRALRAGQGAAGRPRARRAVRPDEPHRLRLRTAAADRAPHRHQPVAPVGLRLPAPPVLRQFWKFIDIDPLPQAQARK